MVLDDRTIKLVANASETDLATYLQDITGLSSNALTIAGHGFTNGTAVTYDAPDPFEFQSGQVDVTITLDGVEVTAISDNTAANNIYFIDEDGNAVAHGLATGDKVFYSSTGAPIGGLVSGTTYRVVKVNDYSIQLKPTDTTTATVSFVRNEDTNAVSIVRTSGTWAANGFSVGTTFVVTGAGSNNGTYTVASVSAQTMVLTAAGDTADVQATRVEGTMAVTPGVAGDGTFDRITRGDTRTWADDGFAPGQTITVNGVSRVVGSVSGSVLALTVRGVLGASVTSVDRGTVSGVTFDSSVIGLTPNKSDASTHSVIDIRDLPIAGLVDGRTYYVTNATTDTFQLAETRALALAGTALTISVPTGGELTHAVHRIGPQGVDLDVSSLAHELRHDLRGSLAGTTQRLLGPGGVPLSVLSPPAGDGNSSASSRGSSGGFVGVGTNSATTHITMTVATSVAADLLAARGNVVIRSTSITSGSASARNGSGGAIAVGNANANVRTVNSSTTTLNGVRVVAGGDVVVEALGTTTSNGASTANAGGGIGLAESDTTVVANHTTLTQLIVSQILAGGLATVRAGTATYGSASSVGDGKGFGADGSADAEFFVGVQLDGSMNPVRTDGTPNRQDSTTRVSIGADSSVVATRTELLAEIVGMAVDAQARAYGAGFYGESDGTGEVRINALNSIDIGARSQVTGVEGVDVIATSNHVDTYAYGFSRATGLFGYVDANAINRTNLDSSITTASTSLITAGPRDPDNADLAHPGMSRLALYISTALGTDVRGRTVAEVSRRALAAGGADETPGPDSETIASTQGVGLSGDVRILSGRSPRLVVDAAGNVTVAIEVTVLSNTAAGIHVDDIVNPGAGNVLVDTKVVSGSGGTWSFRDSLQYVLVRNESSRPIFLGDIDVLNDTTQPQVNFTGPVPQLNTVTFAIRREVTPTVVIIESLNPAVTTNDVHLQGTIRNPIGTTAITVTGGSLISDTARGVSITRINGDVRTALIVTTILQVAAAEQVGSTSRVNVDLVYVSAALTPTSFTTGRVSAVTDAIYLGVDNVFFTGQQVRYTAGTTPIGGLVDGGLYYVTSSGAAITLSLTPGGPAVDLTVTGTLGVAHLLTPVTRIVVTLQRRQRATRPARTAAHPLGRGCHPHRDGGPRGRRTRRRGRRRHPAQVEPAPDRARTVRRGADHLLQHRPVDRPEQRELLHRVPYAGHAPEPRRWRLRHRHRHRPHDLRLPSPRHHWQPLPPRPLRRW